MQKFVEKREWKKQEKNVIIRMKVIERRKPMEKFIPLVERTQCCKVPLDDILYIQQSGRITRIVTENEVYSKYCKAQEYKPYLDKQFFPCLKNLFLNFDQVRAMKDQTIYFKNGSSFGLGRENYVRTKQAFAAYLHKLT